MQKGDIIEVKIESVGMDGEGVARQDGIVVFIPFTLVGERVKCEITFVKKSFAKAKVIKLLEASKDRIQPLCPHFRRCGGCDMQHIIYEKQLQIKRENVANCLKKYASLDTEVSQVVPSPETYYYRNKAQFPLFEKDGKVCLGFFKERTHDFVKIDKCYLLGDWCDKFCSVFLEVANQLKLTCYNEKTQKGLLRHLVLRKLNNIVSVTIVVNSNKFAYADEFVKNLSKIGINFSFYVSYNTKNTNLIMYNANVIFGEKDIQTDILGVKTFVNPMSFMQINDNIRDAIYSKVKQLVIDCKSKIVIDAYSGVGVLTNIIADIADKVYGIEIVPQAVENANQLAKLNGNQDKITNICGDSAVELPKLADKINEQLLSNDSNQKIISSNEQTISNFTLKNDEISGENSKLDKQVENETQSNIQKITDINGQINYISTVKLVEINNESSKLDKETKIKNETNIQTKATCKKGDFIVILDPPRKGCDTQVLEGLLKAQPKNIIYISCNPATLSRDLSILKSHYTPTQIQPYDMFPNTSHIETLVCLERK